MIQIRDSNKALKYFLTAYILVLDTSPFVFDIRQPLWVGLFLFLLLLTHKSGQLLNKKIIFTLFAAWILLALQVVVFNIKVFPALAYRPVYHFYTPYLVFVLFGLNYYKYLYNLIYAIAIYTSFIYLAQTLSPGFNSLLQYFFEAVFPYSWSDWPRTILIYSIPRESGYFFMRNSGVFHEPGAYSIYLMLGIIINTFITNNPTHRRNIFLSIVLITTFSTGGYVMLAVFVAYLLYKSKLHFALKFFVIAPLLVIAVFSFWEHATFLGPKIEEHYITQLEAVERGDKDIRGRFYSFGMSVKAFWDSPVIGSGALPSEDLVGEIGAFGYGFIAVFAGYGLLFGVFYMVNFYKGFVALSAIKKTPLSFILFSFLIINLGLLTQSFFLHVTFAYFFVSGLKSKNQ